LKKLFLFDDGAVKPFVFDILEEQQTLIIVGKNRIMGNVEVEIGLTML
jgi:hypothetical protein